MVFELGEKEETKVHNVLNFTRSEQANFSLHTCKNSPHLLSSRQYKGILRFEPTRLSINTLCDRPQSTIDRQLQRFRFLKKAFKISLRNRNHRLSVVEAV